MPVGLGPRFLIEAGFLVAVAVIAGIARFSTLTIVLVMAAAWLLVAVAEWFAARSRRAHAVARPAPEAVEPAVWAEPRRIAPAEPVRAEQPEPQPAPAPEVTPQQIPEPPSEPEPEAEEEEAEEQDEPSEPVPTQPRVQLVPVATPEPEPVAPPVRAQAPEPEFAPEVVSITSRIGPREWNLWELERIARDSAGTDVARDEERTYLLMYLRDFANADGILPADFDGVVREAFGDVLDAAYSS